MSDDSKPSALDRGPRLLRDILILVVAGAVLGAGYNRLQLAAGEPGRGLTWIKRERALASLEALLADSAASPAVRPVPAAPPPAARDTAPPGLPAAPPASPEPATASAVPERPRADVASRPEARAAATDAPPAAAAERGSAASVPSIPETREPLEAQYPIVKQLHDAGAALFVDARTSGEFAEGHIPGATNLPFDDVFKHPELAKQLDSGGRPIVAYCGGGDCELSKSLAWSLLEGGHRRVLVYLGGMAGWREAGNPVATGGDR